MPELPDVVVYVEALERLLGGQTLTRVVVRSPFLVRTFEPPVEVVNGLVVRGFQRLGKRVVWRFDGHLSLVVHLMIAGRFHWKKVGAAPRGKNDLAAFEFEHGVMMLTEASKKKRASLHVVQGPESLAPFERGGLEVQGCTLEDFAQRLLFENHTLKRSLTDPRLFSGIGNAYSDEILHHARLSPLRWTRRLTSEEIERLHRSTEAVLGDWTERLRKDSLKRFPEKVTAFRKGMAAHGRFGEACPVCQSTIQRIVYADNETNYCPRCQTDGKLLADRSLSRLLKDDWPKTIEQWEGDELS